MFCVFSGLFCTGSGGECDYVIEIEWYCLEFGLLHVDSHDTALWKFTLRHSDYSG